MKSCILILAIVAAAAAQENCECGLFLHDNIALIPGLFSVGPIYELEESSSAPNCGAIAWYECQSYCLDMWEAREADPDRQLGSPAAPGSATTFGQVLCDGVRSSLADDGLGMEAYSNAEVEVWAKINPSCDFYGYLFDAVPQWNLCCDSQAQWRAC